MRLRLSLFDFLGGSASDASHAATARRRSLPFLETGASRLSQDSRSLCRVQQRFSWPNSMTQKPGGLMLRHGTIESSSPRFCLLGFSCFWYCDRHRPSPACALGSFPCLKQVKALKSTTIKCRLSWGTPNGEVASIDRVMDLVTQQAVGTGELVRLAQH